MEEEATSLTIRLGPAALPCESTANEQPLLQEAAAINGNGSWFKQSDYSEGTWDAIEHHALPFDDVCTVFPKGTSLPTVRDHLDTLTISDDDKAEIIEGLFS